MATGEIGELIVRADTPWSMNSGYYGNPEATARAWTASFPRLSRDWVLKRLTPGPTPRSHAHDLPKKVRDTILNAYREFEAAVSAA